MADIVCVNARVLDGDVSCVVEAEGRGRLGSLFVVLALPDTAVYGNILKRFVVGLFAGVDDNRGFGNGLVNCRALRLDCLVASYPDCAVNLKCPCGDND